MKRLIIPALMAGAGFIGAGFAPEVAETGAEGAQALVEWVASFIPEAETPEG